MKILIIGGGMVGSFLAEIFSERHEITVVDKDPLKCEKLLEQNPGLRVFCEDGCEPWVLEYSGVKDADLVLPVTGDDEDNLVISYLAKYEYDVPKVIARVNNPKNTWLFNRSWGVDVEVSASDMIAKIIEEEITIGEIVTIFRLKASNIALVEITLPPDSPANGKSLMEIPFPSRTLVVTVVRGEEMMIPGADTALRSGDKILAVTDVENEEEIERLLGGSK